RVPRVDAACTVGGNTGHPQPPGRGAESEGALNPLGFERRFKARKEIHREVTGLTAEQVHELWVAAGGLESREDQPGPLSTEEQLAALRRNELKRIWALLSSSEWATTYSPENDPDVHRWRQAQREHEAGADQEPVDLIRYRIVAQRTNPEHPGAAVLTHYAYGLSVEEAVTRARTVLEGPGGVYGDQGLYRVVEVAEESPLNEERELELVRRRFVTWAMEAAQAELLEPTGVPHSEMYGLLCDFFNRAIVFPGWGFPFGTKKGDTSLHTSDPARALSRLLLEHLAHHGLDLKERECER
ncbi:hypothetical protein ACFZCG_38855, partial [Streptomyces tanashiensis]